MTESKVALRGSIVALATPFLEDGSIDYACLRQLIDWHIEQDTNCIGVVGTTGESPTITFEEHHEVIRVAVEHAKGRVHIMAGCGGNSTAEAISLARYAKKVGANSQLQVVPYYNKPTQEGQYQHFRAIAQAVSDLPMILYNVPSRTVSSLEQETILRLAQIPSIIGIKEATGDLSRAQWLIRDVPADFGVYSGDDATAVALMLCGGHGNISVTANVAPALMSQLCKAALSADVAKATAIQHRLLPLHKALSLQSNPIPVKWAMWRMGLCGPTLRLPLTLLEKPFQTPLEAALYELNLLGK